VATAIPFSFARENAEFLQITHGTSAPLDNPLSDKTLPLFLRHEEQYEI